MCGRALHCSGGCSTSGGCARSLDTTTPPPPLAWLQSFLKNILDVADNLERAYGAIPADALSEEEGKVGGVRACGGLRCRGLSCSARDQQECPHC